MMKYKNIISIIIVVFFCGKLNAQVNSYYEDLGTGSFASMITSIKAINASPDDIIRTSVGSEYIVDSLALTTGSSFSEYVSIPLNNGNYANLQLRDRGFYIEDFGAIANDGAADHEAIQNCIDAVIALYDITSIVNAGPGKFDLDKGVVIANEIQVDGDYTSVTLTLSGAIHLYTTNQSIGSATFFHLRTSSFCVAVQESRNCIIENIFFEGEANYESVSDEDFVLFKESDWQLGGTIRTDRYSPDCAIAIDPFHDNVPSANRYPDHDGSGTSINRYQNGENEGSSMLLIRGCAFRYHYIAVSNNSSSGAQNGDNIRIENSSVKRCNTFWAAGQTQSRGNSIENIYSQFVKTFVDCGLIGDKNGTPPSVSNCNIAGFTKELIRSTNGGYNQFRVNNTYMESIFSLGSSNANTVSFNQCQIKFNKPNEDIFMPPYHLDANGKPISFIDCSIEYFDNCDTKVPFLFLTKALTVTGCYIEGGVVLPAGYTASGGDQMHNVNFENTFLKCVNNEGGSGNGGSIAGQRQSGNAFIYQAHKRIMLGGEEIHFNMNNGNCIFKNEGPTYNYYSLGTEILSVDTNSKKGTIVTSNSGKYVLGDNLITSNDIDPSAAEMDGSSFKGVIGYVSNIQDDTITITGIPYGLSDTLVYLYVVDYPRFYLPSWGDLTNGSNIISNVVSRYNGVATKYFPPINSRIVHPDIPSGAYVKAINTTTNEIELSMNATKTVAYTPLYNIKCSQKIEGAYNVNHSSTDSTSTSNDKDRVYIDGARIYLGTPDIGLSNTAGYVVTKGGYPSNAIKPILRPIIW